MSPDSRKKERKNEKKEGENGIWAKGREKFLFVGRGSKNKKKECEKIVLKFTLLIYYRVFRVLM